MAGPVASPSVKRIVQNGDALSSRHSASDRQRDAAPKQINYLLERFELKTDQRMFLINYMIDR
jgi:hypothetical protein